MGFLQTVRDALALPAMAAAPVGYESPWAGESHLLPVVIPESPDVPITRHLAMSVPALSRARRLIVGSIARCDLVVTRGGEPVAEQPRWTSRTDGPVSPFHRMLWTIDDLLFYGASLWAVQRDSEGSVIAADRVPFERWTLNQDGEVLFNGSPVDPHSIVLIPGVDEGVLDHGRTPIRHAYDLNAAAAKAAKTPIAHTELHQTSGEPMSREQAKQLVEGWIAARRSPDGAVSFTNSSIEVKTHGTFDSALLVEGRQAAAVDIARLTGIPALLLDAATSDGSVRYSNVDARNREFIDFCLAPYMAAVVARLGMDDVVPRGNAVEFDTTNLVGIDAAEVQDLEVPDDTNESEK